MSEHPGKKPTDPLQRPVNPMEDQGGDVPLDPSGVRADSGTDVGNSVPPSDGKAIGDGPSGGAEK